MKRIILYCALIFLPALALRADLVIVQKVDGVGHTGEMTLKVKDNLMRMDISPEMSAISDAAAGTMTALMHKQKSCMQIDLDSAHKLMEQFQKARGPGKDDAGEKLTATGQKETVNGFETTVYTFRTGNLSIKYWIAKDFPQADKLLAALKQIERSPLAAMAHAMVAQPPDLPGVPVKVEMDNVGSGTKIVSTIVSVKEQPLDASEFTVPADYQMLTMPSFGGPGGHLPKHKANPQPEQ